MATIQTHAEQQLIPTNAGGRSFAGPPKALQSNVTPTELFYVRNHWKGAPDIDPDTYRLVVDGEVARDLDLSLSRRSRSCRSADTKPRSSVAAMGRFRSTGQSRPARSWRR